MFEMDTSSLMSGEGKQSAACEAPVKRPSSTLLHWHPSCRRCHPFFYTGLKTEMRAVLSPDAGISRWATMADGSFTPPARYPAEEKSMMLFPRASYL
jgi:hypothetical protein